MQHKIPFNRLCITGPELSYVSDAIRGGHTSGGGPFTQRAERILEQRTRCAAALLTTSCTAAMEMAAILCDLQPGDEVILPSYTFVSTANAVVLRGAKPVFVDIRADTANLDERLIEAAITPHTKAIIPVHYGGVSCDMDAIMEIARRHSLAVIEDAAQGFAATYKGRPLGTIGDCGCYSFHETKNISCGEGGALLVNNRSLLPRAHVIRDKGTNRRQFLDGQVDRYTWVDIGSSYVLADLLAAFLVGQLEHADAVTARRRQLCGLYQKRLQPLITAGRISLPLIPPDCGPNHHIFLILMGSLAERTALISHLNRNSILAVFHYVPLHSSPFGVSLGGAARPLPVTDDVSSRALRLPLFAELTPAEVGQICDSIATFFGVDPGKR